MVVELFHEDVWTNLQTDMMKLTVAFHNFVTVHKNQEKTVTWKCIKQFSHSNNHEIGWLLLFPPRQTLYSSSTKMLTSSFTTIFLLKEKEIGVGVGRKCTGNCTLLAVQWYNETTRDQNSFCCRYHKSGNQICYSFFTNIMLHHRLHYTWLSS